MRKMVLLTAAAVALSGVGVPSALADDFECNGVLTGTINGNVVVRPGATCTLRDADVRGNVKVEPTGALGIEGGIVRGNVEGDQARYFYLTRSDMSRGEVRGNVVFKRTFDRPPGGQDNYICYILIRGNLELVENGSPNAPILVGDRGGPIPFCTNPMFPKVEVRQNLKAEKNSHRVDVSDTIVGQNLELIENVDTHGGGGTFVFRNQVSQKLECKGNAPISGGGNTAEKKEGQCAAF